MINIIKRDGTKECFNSDKIRNAIKKSMIEANDLNFKIIEDIVEKMEQEITENQEVEFTVEAIQDMVEEALMTSGAVKAAKKYILYRNKRNELRNRPWELTDIAKDTMKKKYYADGEDFDQWIKRISAGNTKIEKLIRDKKFLFGGRILANRGLSDVNSNVKLTYSNCYVISAPEDNIESIYETASKLARTFSYGGGCGINIGKLRPEGAIVNNAAKSTSGAVSFMELFNLTTEIIAQRGRRGALMLSMPVSHPDIEDFVNIKLDLNKITKANISLMIDDKFMEAVINRQPYYCRFDVEATGEVIVRELDAYKLFMRLCKNNWDMAEPGMLFWDRITGYNLMSADDTFELAGTNPCAEEPLPAGGSCLLGSLNLAEFVNCPFTENAYFDFEKFVEAVEIAIVALDEVLDEGMDLHPLQEQRDSVFNYRQIGLGVMGIADMLIRLGIKYGDDESLELCDKIARMMLNSSVKRSALLAKENGPFPQYTEKVLESPLFENLDEDVFELVEEYGLRHSALLTIPPCGTISLLLGVSGGIEPIFQMSYMRKTESLHDEEFYYKVYTPIAQEYMKMHNIEEDKLPDFFVAAGDIPYQNRIKMQAVWQKYVDAAISSTVNLPEETTVEEVAEIYINAWRSGLKGITVYRDGCSRGAVLVNTKKENKKEENKKKEQPKPVEEPPKGECPKCGQPMAQTGGCDLCLNCGWSKCQ